MCTLSVTLGGVPLFTQVVTNDAYDSAKKYTLVTRNAIQPTSQVADLSFAFSCNGFDAKDVYLDDVVFEPIC